MNDEPEFGIVNIFLGGYISLLIFNCIFKILFQMFNYLSITFAIIMCMLYFIVGMIIYRETRVWAKAV